jgi:small subunit ribosomal protein S17
MATTKKTETETAAAKKTPAKKPAAAEAPTKKAPAKTTPAKKAAAKKAPAKKAPVKKAVAKKAPVKKAAPAAAAKAAAKPAKKQSAARLKAKAERPAPERVPGRKERRGIVVKTIVVRIDAVKKHSRYGKVVRRSSKLHAHDEGNSAGVGDLVRVVETRPLSATKRWRLLEVLERAK